MTKIYLDFGHGGTDPGAVGNGLKEKDLTLKIGLKIKALLSAYNVLVKCSRETDKTVSLQQRTDDANDWDADYVVSIHINAGGGEGFETFIQDGLSNTSNTSKYRTIIHNEIMELLDFKDRGKKKKNLHMTRESNASAILTESGFIDNVGDANKLKSDSYLDKIAQGHVNGLVKAFNLKKKVVTEKAKILHIIQRGETLYKIADKYGTNISDIMKLNPKVIHPSKIYVGNTLNIPVK